MPTIKNDFSSYTFDRRIFLMKIAMFCVMYNMDFYIK
jgi:hypothetical protein